MTESNTRSGIPLKSVYTPEDVKNQYCDKHLGAPGEYPYTRKLCGECGQRTSMPQLGIRGMLTAVNELGKGNREHGLDYCRC